MSSVYQLFELYTALQLFEPQTQYGKAHMQTPVQIQGWLLDRRGTGEGCRLLWRGFNHIHIETEKAGCEWVSAERHYTLFSLTSQTPCLIRPNFHTERVCLNCHVYFFFSPALRQSKCLFCFRVSDGWRWGHGGEQCSIVPFTLCNRWDSGRKLNTSLQNGEQTQQGRQQCFMWMSDK